MIDRKQAKLAAKDYASAFSLGELCAAAHNGKFDIVRRLIEGGESPNLRNRFGRTPLMYAAEKGHLQIARWLIQQGAEVNAQTPKDPEVGGELSALHFASGAQQIGMIELLIERGADINLQDECGITPLVCALSERSFKAAEKLLSLGANFNIPDQEGQTAIGVAVQMGANEIVELLLRKGADFRVLDDTGQSLLHFAASNDDSLALQRFLSLGLPVNQISSLSGTPLICACVAGASNAAKILLEAGASVNATTTDEHRWTALFYAVAARSPRLVDLLLRHGADVKQKCPNPLAGSYKNGPELLTARELAARHPNVEVIRLLETALASPHTASS